MKGIEMTTITKTTAAAVSRKLSSMGFEKFSVAHPVGYEVYTDNDYAKTIICSHRTYDNGYKCTIVDELREAGYEVEMINYMEKYGFNPENVSQTMFAVIGKR